jgi:hypothetical protein
VFLVNSRYPLVYATPSGSVRKELHPNEALLLPKLRRYFAEFLNHSSPDRLGILYPPTCVGLGYGHRVNSLLGFSRQHGISDFVWIDSASRLGILTNSHRSSLHAYPGTTIARVDLPSCVAPLLPAGIWSGLVRRQPPGSTPLGLARTRWYRNINLLCIDYALRPRLSSRLTLGG